MDFVSTLATLGRVPTSFGPSTDLIGVDVVVGDRKWENPEALALLLSLVSAVDALATAAATPLFCAAGLSAILN